MNKITISNASRYSLILKLLHIFFLFTDFKFAQSPGAEEYTDCTSAEG